MKRFPGMSPEDTLKAWTACKSPVYEENIQKAARSFRELYEILKANPDKYLKIVSGKTDDSDVK